MIWFTFFQNLINQNLLLSKNTNHTHLIAKSRPGIPLKCKLGFHDKETTHQYISVDGVPINRKTCKDCERFILPESYIKHTDLANQSSVVVIKTEEYFYTPYKSTGTLTSSTSRPPEKVNDINEEVYDPTPIKATRITSVQRKSDGEIFSIGDKVEMIGYNETTLSENSVHPKTGWIIKHLGIGYNEIYCGEKIHHLSVSFEHTSCYQISIGLLKKIK